MKIRSALVLLVALSSFSLNGCAFTFSPVYSTIPDYSAMTELVDSDLAPFYAKSRIYYSSTLMPLVAGGLECPEGTDIDYLTDYVPGGGFIYVKDAWCCDEEDHNEYPSCDYPESTFDVSYNPLDECDEEAAGGTAGEDKPGDVNRWCFDDLLFSEYPPPPMFLRP